MKDKMIGVLAIAVTGIILASALQAWGVLP